MHTEPMNEPGMRTMKTFPSCDLRHGPLKMAALLLPALLVVDEFSAVLVSELSEGDGLMDPCPPIRAGDAVLLDAERHDLVSEKVRRSTEEPRLLDVALLIQAQQRRGLDQILIAQTGRLGGRRQGVDRRTERRSDAPRLPHQLEGGGAWQA